MEVSAIDDFVVSEGREAMSLRRSITGEPEDALTPLELVSMVVHDIRNGLQVAQLASDALCLVQEPERKLEALDLLDVELGHLARLVEDLSWASAGRHQCDRRPTDVLAHVRHAVDIMDLGPTRVRPTGAGSVWVKADPSHLYRIISNLLVNAHKYGEPPVDVLVSPAGQSVSVKVIDCGPGVSETFIPRLFDPHTRDFDLQPSGYGLGLTIVQELARANGGEVAYRPNAPKGSIFELKLERAMAGSSPRQ